MKPIQTCGLLFVALVLSLLPFPMVMAASYNAAVEGSYGKTKGNDNDGSEFDIQGRYYFDPVDVKGSLTHRDYEQRISSVSIKYSKAKEDEGQGIEIQSSTDTEQEFDLSFYVPDSLFYGQFEYQKLKIDHDASVFSPAETEDVVTKLLFIGGFVHKNTSVGLINLTSDNSFNGGSIDIDVTGPAIRDSMNSGPNYFGYQLAQLKGDFGDSFTRLYAKVRLIEVFYAMENTFQVGVNYQKYTVDRLLIDSKLTTFNAIYAITHSMTLELEHSRLKSDSTDDKTNTLKLGVHF